MTSPEKLHASPIWHPFTQHAVAPPMTPIARGDGAWLETTDGRRILDGISSWWVITHGHRHPRIIDAVRTQLDDLDQVIFAGFTHEPAETLAAGLIGLTPNSLTRVFYSDSGSTAVEVALKMALGYWRNTGANRTRILALENAYHGDTVGTMSAGERGVFNAAYEPLLFDVERLPFPAGGRQQDTIDALEAACRREPKPAALILEPLVLGAGGMHMYDAETLRTLRDICTNIGTLFIADEVMTGWGRTGKLFACDHAGIAPDILCLAKGLTGGSLPLAATLCREDIYEAHYSTDRTKTFFHSSSFTANPICCAAACANIEIWNTEPVTRRIAALTKAQSAALDGFADDKRFTNLRQLGTITALDLTANDAGYLADIGPRLYEAFLKRGCLIRPLGNTIYLMPPYCITAADLNMAYAAIDAAADEAVRP